MLKSRMGFIDNNNRFGSASHRSSGHRMLTVNNSDIDRRSFRDNMPRGRYNNNNNNINNNNNNNNNSYGSGEPVFGVGINDVNRRAGGSFVQREFMRFGDNRSRGGRGGTGNNCMQFGNGGRRIYENGSMNSSAEPSAQQDCRKFGIPNNRTFVAGDKRTDGRAPEAYEILDDNNIVERSTLMRRDKQMPNYSNNNNRGRFRNNNANLDAYAGEKNTIGSNNYFKSSGNGTNYRPFVARPNNNTTRGNYNQRSAHYDGENNNNTFRNNFDRQERRFQPYKNNNNFNNYHAGSGTYVKRGGNNFVGSFGSNNNQAQENAAPQFHDRYRLHLQPGQQQQPTAPAGSTNSFAEENGGMQPGEERAQLRRRRSLTPANDANIRITGKQNFAVNSNSRRRTGDDDDGVTVYSSSRNSRMRRSSGGAASVINRFGTTAPPSIAVSVGELRQSACTQRELLSPPNALSHASSFSNKSASRLHHHDHVVVRGSHAASTSSASSNVNDLLSESRNSHALNNSNYTESHQRQRDTLLAGRSAERSSSLGGSAPLRRSNITTENDSDEPSREQHYSTNFSTAAASADRQIRSIASASAAITDSVKILLDDASPTSVAIEDDADDDADDDVAGIHRIGSEPSPTSSALLESPLTAATSSSFCSRSRCSSSHIDNNMHAAPPHAAACENMAATASRASSKNSAERGEISPFTTLVDVISAKNVKAVSTHADSVEIATNNITEPLRALTPEVRPQQLLSMSIKSPPPATAAVEKKPSLELPSENSVAPKFTTSNILSTHGSVLPSVTASAKFTTSTLFTEQSLSSNNNPATNSSLMSFMQSLPVIPAELTSSGGITNGPNNITNSNLISASRKKAHAPVMDFDYDDPRFGNEMLLTAAANKTLAPSLIQQQQQQQRMHLAVTSESNSRSKLVDAKSKVVAAAASKQAAPEITLSLSHGSAPFVKAQDSTASVSDCFGSADTKLHAPSNSSALKATIPAASGRIVTAATRPAPALLGSSFATSNNSLKSGTKTASIDVAVKHQLFAKADTPVIVSVKQEPVVASRAVPPPPIITFDSTKTDAEAIIVSGSPVLTAGGNNICSKTGVTTTTVDANNKSLPPQVPLLPEKDRKKYDKFLQVIQDPNGGCTTVQVQWLEVVEHFRIKYSVGSNGSVADAAAAQVKMDARLQQFVQYFYSRAFEDDEHGFPRHVMGVLRGAARTLPCLLHFLERRHSNMPVKVGSLLNDNETLSKTLREFGAKFREGLDSLSGTSNTCGPMHAISCVGRKGEESGALLTDLLDVLEAHIALTPVMPWGEISHLHGMRRGESDDGPILWIRPGEQTIAAAELTDAEWRGVSDLNSASHHYLPTGDASSAGGGVGGARRGPRWRRELKDLGLAAYSRFSLQPQREHVYEDRTRPHADHAGGGSLYLPTAAVGILKAIQPRVYLANSVGSDDEDADNDNDDDADKNVNHDATKTVALGLPTTTTTTKPPRRRHLTDSARSTCSSSGGRAGGSRAASRASFDGDDSDNNNSKVSPDFVHGRVTKDVVCFDAKSQRDLSNLLQIDYFEKPVKQCPHFVSWPKLNWLRRQGIRFSRLLLEDGDIYVIPRGVVHQFNTIAAVCSIAWHVRLRQYYENFDEIVPFSFMLTANSSKSSMRRESDAASGGDALNNNNKSTECRKNATTLADAYTTTPADDDDARSDNNKHNNKRRTVSGGTSASSCSSNGDKKRTFKKKRHYRFVGGAATAAAKAMRLKRKKLASTATTKKIGSGMPRTVSVSTAAEQQNSDDDDVLAGGGGALGGSGKAKIKRHMSVAVYGNDAAAQHEARQLRKKLKKQKRDREKLQQSVQQHLDVSAKVLPKLEKFNNTGVVSSTTANNNNAVAASAEQK